MGTFHRDAEPLHGITVIVETSGPTLYIGRFDSTTPAGILLHDADRNDEGPGPGRMQWLDQARRFGHWPKHKAIVVPTAEVSSIRRLGDQ
jgi:hypothetical protein